MTNWNGPLLAVATVSGIPLVVVAALASSGALLRRAIPGLVAFGAGALAGAAIFHLLPESYERHPAASWVAVCAAGGLIGSYLLERLLHRLDGSGHEQHPHDDAASTGAEADDRAMVTLNLLGDAIHNVVDGVLVAASFLAGAPTGVLVSAAVLAHELPRELGTFALFLHYGVSPRRAVMYNALTGLMALGGAALTVALGTQVAQIAAVVVPFAAGSFLYLAGAVVLSQLRHRGAYELSATQALCGGLGLGLSALARLWA